MPELAIQPGATAFTRTPCLPHSNAAVWVRLAMPARAAPEWAMPGMPRCMSAVMFTIAPPCCFHRGVEHGAHHLPAAGQIGRDHRVPALFGDVGDFGRELPARIIDQAVDAAMALNHSRDTLENGVFLADIEADGVGLAAIVFDLGCDRVELVLLSADQDHRRA
jgi:hypothetical protein